jgi:hypothetical protein
LHPIGFNVFNTEQILNIRRRVGVPGKNFLQLLNSALVITGLAPVDGFEKQFPDFGGHRVTEDFDRNNGRRIRSRRLKTRGLIAPRRCSKDSQEKNASECLRKITIQ